MNLRIKNLYNQNRLGWTTWVALGLGPNLLFQNIDIWQALSLLALIVLTLFTGDTILKFTGLEKKHFSSISWAGLSFLTALLILIPTLFIPSWGVAAYCLLLITSVLALERKNDHSEDSIWTVKHEFLFLASAILALLLINYQELLKFPFIDHVFSPAEKNPDSAFFTAIVSTYAGDHYQGAAFEIGTPIKYHIFSYLFPAVIKQFTGVSAFVAYNHIFCPFSYLLYYLLLIDLARQLFPKTVKSSPYVYALVPVSYILLVPINPLGVLSLDPSRVIWGGPGFIAPGGNLASSIGLVLTVLCLMLWSTLRQAITIRKTKLTALFSLLLWLLLINKITFFIAFATFCFFDQLLFLVKKKELQYLYHSIRMGSIFLVLLVANSIFSSQENVSIDINYGYLINQFNILNLQSPLLALFGTLALLIFWLLTRAIIIFFARSNKLSIHLFLASIFAIFAMAIPSILFSVEVYAHDLAVDKTFDLVQFLRAGFAVASIVAVSVVPLALTINQRTVSAFFLALAFIIGPTYVNRIARAQPPNKYEYQYTSEFPNAIVGKLTAIYPIDNFRSIQIASTGLLQMYSAMDFSAKGGYNIGSLHPTRWQNIGHLDNQKLSIKEKLLPLQQDSVEYLVTVKEFREPLDSVNIVFENKVIVVQKIPYNL